MSHVGDRLTALVDGRLGAAEQDKVMAHVRHCAQCRDALAREHWIQGQLKQLPGAEPSAALLLNLQDIGSDPSAAVPIDDVPRAQWWLPTRRRAVLAVAGAGTAAASLIGLAYVVGGAPAAEPVRPPVERYSAEFAGGGAPPFSDPTVDVITVFDQDANPVSRR